MKPERLYGLPGADVMEYDLAAVWEVAIEPFVGDDETTIAEGPWVIEEWTVRPAIDEVPCASTIVERIEEDICDNGEFTDDPFESKRLIEHPDVIEAAEHLRQLVASKVTWFMADKKVAEHIVTLVDDDPHVDGEPMYRRVR